MVISRVLQMEEEIIGIVGLKHFVHSKIDIQMKKVVLVRLCIFALVHLFSSSLR